MESGKRTTQKELAARAGVHQTTVSMAMRNHPSVAEHTRKKVLSLARKMGYRPDPMLSALINYRNEGTAKSFRGSLAWLARSTDRFTWRRETHFVNYLKGAWERADHLGYKVEVIDVGELGVGWRRAGSILKARGISGVLLCPQVEDDERIVDFPWAQFSAVRFGFSVKLPQSQLVAPDQFRAAQRVTLELWHRGYRRIGYLSGRSLDERTGFNFVGGYSAALAQLGAVDTIPVCQLEPTKDEAMYDWYERHRPDAIVVTMEYLYRLLLAKGLHAPRDFGLACPATVDSELEVSGVEENDESIGAEAVSMLVSNVQRGHVGLPVTCERLLIEGSWVEGATIRPTANAADDVAITADDSVAE